MTAIALDGRLDCPACGGRRCRLCNPPLDSAQAGLTEIRLYGTLGRQFGRVHRLAVHSVREAMQALAIVLPGFGKALLEHEPGYHVLLGKAGGRAGVREERLDAPVSRRESICVVPVIVGAKRSGLFQIIAGVALLALAPYAAGALFGVGSSLATNFALAIANYSGKVAMAMILGGVVQMLSPQRRGGVESRPENAPSYAFDGPVNPSPQGTAVPLRYGRLVCGGVPVSGGISTEDIVPAAGAASMPPQTLPSYQWQDPAQSPDWVGA